MATVQPANSSELQLYRVLQRANLLQYFETFITQGGDDVQQLCEAGEDEFLEIMALVGMASKPLHVRRLQKALQEWVANPAAFEVIKKYPTHVMSMAGSTSQSVSPSHSVERSNSLQDYKVTPPQSSAISTSTPWTCQGGVRAMSPSDGSNLEHPSPSDSPPTDFKEIMKDVLYNPDDQSYPGMMGLPQPALLEHQITAIATAAAMLAQNLPPFEPKSMPKKQISKEISCVMMMALNDPNRMDALRKYAAIYGRFDSKRKNDRPMSLHEISVNEAAAQLCSHFPALLTRREELFPLARQVVRDSGYQYSKGHSRYDLKGAAEVLVQPKIEQGESIASTSSLLAHSTAAVNQDESFNDLQRELTQITLELSEMAKEQDRIRSALRVLLEANDHDQMKTLTSEMDELNDRQTVLTKKKQRIVNTISKFRKGTPKQLSPKASIPLELSKHSSPLGHGSGKRHSKSSSPYGYGDETAQSNPLNTLYMAALHNHRDSLFDEGLRIATQYGMADFAQELMGMKSKDKDDENGDSSIPASSESGGNSAFAVYSSMSSSAAETSMILPSNPSTLLIDCKTPDRPSGVKAITTPTEKSKYDPHGKKSVNISGYTSATISSNDAHRKHVGAVGLSHLKSSISDKGSSPVVDTTSVSVERSLPKGSTTTTTMITTKTGQVIEVETRRSSRRKNGEPDYYLINGGEKRFRGGNSRRSSSTSSERTRRLSSSSSTSSVNPSTPTAVSPIKILKTENQIHGDDIIRMHMSELRRRDGTEIQKVTLDFNNSNEVDLIESNSQSDVEGGENDVEKRIIRKKTRVHPYNGQRHIGELNSTS
ncbi:unnamed protein product [Lymnaea stagnalis]|uniref:Uncharacterized protein n=1 Tax=Lymnaea stagnalis TaxID=6523 RepID=A0AAV2IJH1_LYMST